MLEIVIPDVQEIVLKTKDGTVLFSEEATTLSCLIDDVQEKVGEDTEKLYKEMKDMLEKRYNCPGKLSMDAVYVIFLKVKEVMDSLKKTT